MNKAKTSQRLIIWLSVIIGAVFAIMMGVVYASPALSRVHSTNPKSATAYAGNQCYTLINDTITQPVPFGTNGGATNVSLKYSYMYDFDVRIKYSMSWLKSGSVVTTATDSTGTSKTLSFDGVILNYVDRDNLIVDENYIFVATTLTKGSGTIPIVASVDFVDSNDALYKGLTLRINISEVKISAKASSASALAVSGSPASDAWLKIKNSGVASGTAYVMVYNSRYDYDHGVKYPGAETAYKKDITTSAGVSSMDATWLGGNRAYAGTGIYVITGSSAISLRTKVTGVWKDGTSSNASESVIFENNIQYNYSKNWTRISYDENMLFANMAYDYVIPANTHCYIPILDSVEITSASIQTYDKDSFRIVTSLVEINNSDQLFSYETTASSNKHIRAGVVQNSTETTIGTYAKEQVTIVNNSIYQNGLCDSFAGSSAVSQNYRTSVGLINNTANYLNVTASFVVSYHLTNGSTILATGDSGEKQRAESFDDIQFYEATVDGTDTTSNSLKSVVLAPYSYVEICSAYTVPANVSVRTSYQNYDFWSHIKPTITTTTATESQASKKLSVETTFSGDSIAVYLRNNSTVKVTSATVLLEGFANAMTYSSSAVGTEPVDWDVSFWKYYLKSGTTYTQLQTKPDVFAGSNYYLGTRSYMSLTLPNSSLQNGFSTSDRKTYTSSSLALNPGDSAMIFSFTPTITTSSQYVLGPVIYNMFGSATASTTTTVDSVALINAGTSQAYLINNSTNSCFAKFGGTVASSESSKFYTADSFNHYLGVLRPNQIVPVSMTASDTSKATTWINVTTYVSGTSGTLKDWNATFRSKMDSYFSAI